MVNLSKAVSRNGHRQITFEDLKGLRAEGYIRDSTLDQRDGFGPDIQRRNIQRFAEIYGLILGNRYYTEFVSGRAVEKRKEFRQFVEDAHLDGYDVLLVDHTSRFGRNQAECIHYKEELQRLGKVVVFVSQGIISGSDNHFLAERIHETMDEQYSRSLSRYVASGLAEKAAQGIANGVPPLGYKSEKQDNCKRERKAADQETMPVLLELLRCYSSGKYSYQTLADHLNSLGYRTRNRKPFTIGSIEQVLENRFYDGKAVYHPGKPDEEVREGTHEVPPEVKELWLKCQEIKSRRAKPWSRGPREKSRAYLFSGLLTCSACGSRYKGLASHHGHSNLRQRLVHQRSICAISPRSQCMEALSQQFASGVLAFLNIGEDFQDKVIQAVARQQGRPSAEDQVQRLERALGQIRKQNQWGDLSDEDYLKERDSLRRQLQALKSGSQPIQTPNLKRAAELLNELPALWQHPGVQDSQRQALLQEVFDEVQINGRDIVAVRPKPQYLPHFAYLTLWQRGCPTAVGVDSTR